MSRFRGLRPRTPKILGLPGPDPGAYRRGLRAPEPLYGAYPAPTPGVHFLSFERPAGGDEDRGLRAVRTKVNRKSASPLWAGPRPLPNRTPAMEHCAATECLFCLRLPRNRYGGSPTSPDGPRDDRHFSSSRTNRCIYPFKRASAEVG